MKRGTGARKRRRKPLSARTMMTTVAGRMIAQGDADFEKRGMRFNGQTKDAPKGRFSNYLASGLSKGKGMQFEDRIRRNRRFFVGVCAAIFGYWLVYMIATM